MNSPDVVSTLHNMSGIASGAEPVSGLYVHGGDHDENLVLLDGAPLYHVNHMGGLFSAFNTDVVKNVDFYKVLSRPDTEDGCLRYWMCVRATEACMSFVANCLWD